MTFRNSTNTHVNVQITNTTSNLITMNAEKYFGTSNLYLILQIDSKASITEGMQLRKKFRSEIN